MSKFTDPYDSIFEGGAFHSDFSNGRQSGALSFESGFIVFRGSAGASVRLALETLKIERGGAADRIVFITSPEHPDWKLFTSDRSILKSPALVAHSGLQKQRRGITKKLLRMRMVTLAVLFALGLGVFGTIQMRDFVVAFVARNVPQEIEVWIGETVFGQVRQSSRILENAELSSALDSLMAPLLAALPEEGYTYTVAIVDDPTLNAFAMPGGFIVIHSGLIAEAERAEEVLGVLAHEIAHITEQHTLRRLIELSVMRLALAVFLGDVEGLGGILVGSSERLLTMQFSRDDEVEADRVGLSYLEAAGIDPSGLLMFFEKILRREPEYQKHLELLSTHPATEDRMAAIEERISQIDLSKFEPFDFDFPAFESLVRSAIETTSSSEISANP